MTAKPEESSDFLPRRKFLISTGGLLAVSSIPFGSISSNAHAQSTQMPPLIAPSPNWSQAMPPAPDTRGRITKAYAEHVGRDSYFWAWPMVNVYNRRLHFATIKEAARFGPLIQAPVNQFAMLTDYVDPNERAVACPNQDVVYGLGAIGLDLSPVVLQVPDFGDRFWVYQVVDLRTDSFVQLGKMYNTTPGFYLLVGPDWKGAVPKGITKVFRSPTNTGLVGPRIFMDDTPEDRKAVQSVLKGVLMYPLSEFDRKMKSKDWANIPMVAAPPQGEEEAQWVFPEKFADEIEQVFKDAPPLPGEEARYAQVLAVLEAARRDPSIKNAMTDGARQADEQLVKPLFQFHNFGEALPYNWGTISNESAFGTDYYVRTATAKANILVNSPNETKYYYQDLDEGGARLNSSNRYVVTFGPGGTPPVHGFWSLSIYNEHHFFVPNAINRFSVGTKNKDLKRNADGSLSIYVQVEEPVDPLQRANWLPAPQGDFSLYIRAYWPKAEVLDGSWTPPAVKRA